LYFYCASRVLLRKTSHLRAFAVKKEKGKCGKIWLIEAIRVNLCPFVVRKEKGVVKKPPVKKKPWEKEKNE